MERRPLKTPRQTKQKQHLAGLQSSKRHFTWISSEAPHPMKKSAEWTLLAVTLAEVLAGGTAYSSTSTTSQTYGVSALTLACLNNFSSSLFLTLNRSKTGGTTSWVVLFGVFGTDSSGNSFSITGSGTIPSGTVSGKSNNNRTHCVSDVSRKDEHSFVSWS